MVLKLVGEYFDVLKPLVLGHSRHCESEDTEIPLANGTTNLFL